MADRHFILALIGPTASGKSALAFEIARHLGAEILSADSMQVYRHMDIGTAKPTHAERQLVVHHLIDVIDPTETFAAGAFVARADEVIASARSRGVPLIVTGGTPLYYKVLFEGLFEGPEADLALRERLDLLDADALHEQLRAVDPEAALRLHRNDRKRIIRALEVFELTGKPISAQQREWGTRTRHPAHWIGLNWDREQLSRRINARVHAMIDAGWVGEVEALLARFGTLSRTASEATGYQELIRFVRDHPRDRTKPAARDDALDECVEHIKIATRQLARRQIKWFRRFESVHWLAGAKPLEPLTQESLAHLKTLGCV